MKKNAENGFVSVKDLSKKNGLSVHQINDYINRGLLRVAKYAKRTRLLADPPSSRILADIQHHLEKNGNLRGCETYLKGLYPEYYGPV